MSIQASISNRSWFKAQWAKLLVFIALIVPLLGMKKGNQGAEAGGGFILEPLTKSESLRLHSSLPKEKAADEVSFLEEEKQPLDENQPTTDLSPTPLDELTGLDETAHKRLLAKLLRESIWPKEENGKLPEELDTRLYKLHLAKEKFEQRNAADTKEGEFWLQLTMDYIRGGHFDFAAKLMSTDPTFFHHSDLTFFHEALAQLARKMPTGYDLKNVDVILEYSNCADWKEAKFKVFCRRANEILTVTSETDKPLLRSIIKKFNDKLSMCNGQSKTACHSSS